MPFSPEQVKQLLQPINPKRVLRDPRGNAHVSQQDVTAHLTRIFGFGGWSKEVLDVQLVFESEREQKGKWDVAYKALVRLTVRDSEGTVVASYEDGSHGSAQNQNRQDAHDLAYKSAISLSTKRAAKDLGDQFGLSLYNKGQMTSLVGGTLVGGPDPETPADIQANVEQQVAMGNDEIDTPAVVEPETVVVAEKESVKVRKPAVAPKEQAIQKLKDYAAKSGGDTKAVNAHLKAINALYLTTYKVGVADGSADDLKAFTALLETGAIKVPA